VHQLLIDLKKAYVLVGRNVSYNILIESGVPMKLVMLIKMCLTETCSRVWVGKNLTCFLLGMVCNKEMLCHHFFQLWLRVHH